jgi:hypothetical protein
VTRSADMFELVNRVCDWVVPLAHDAPLSSDLFDR